MADRKMDAALEYVKCLEDYIEKWETIRAYRDVGTAFEHELRQLAIPLEEAKAGFVEAFAGPRIR